MFTHLIGQEKTKHYFTRVIESGKMPHSFLLYGPEGTGKTAAALELAQIVTCHDPDRRPCGECVSCAKFRKMEHPDVLLFFPVPGVMKPEEIQQIRGEIACNPYRKIELHRNASLHIDMVRAIKKHLRLRSYQGHGRVVILLGCETLNLDTGNALLKLLEEPPDNVSFVLTTTVLDDVLPTIRSRCQLLHLSYLSTGTIAEALRAHENIPEEESRYFALLSGGSYARALEFLQDDFIDKKTCCSKILEYCAVKPMEEIIALEEKLTDKYNVNEIKSILELLIAMLKRNYESAIVYPDNQPDMDSLMGLPQSVVKTDTATIEKVVSDIEISVDLLNKNVYLNTILLILFFKLGGSLGNEQLR